MTEPQCRVMRTDAPHELREVCAADAFARLSTLHRACGRTLYWDGSTYHDGWAAEWELEREYLAEDAHGLDHAQRVARLDESELHFAWRLAKCRTVPTAAMERVIGLHAPHHRLNIQDTELLVVAARLGSVLANTQVGGGDAELDAAATANVALAYLRRAVGAALGKQRFATDVPPVPACGAGIRSAHGYRSARLERTRTAVLRCRAESCAASARSPLARGLAGDAGGPDHGYNVAVGDCASGRRHPVHT